jgi:DNA-binding NtrC family response regulator
VAGVPGERSSFAGVENARPPFLFLPGSPSLQARVERDYILKELDRTHGNISHAAETVGLESSHLYRKMKTLGIHLGE